MIRKLIVIILAIAVLLVPLILYVDNDSKESLNVFVIAGQSNAEYYYVDLNEVNAELPEPNNDVLYYGQESRPIKLSQDSLANLNFFTIHSMFNHEWTVGNLDSSLAYYLSEYYHSAVLVINVGILGQKISAISYNHWSSIEMVICSALKSVDLNKYDIVKGGVFWVQGENDADTSIDEYITDFKVLQSKFDKLGFNEIVISQCRNGVNSSVAQEIIAQTLDNVKISTIANTFSLENDTLKPDLVHYTQKADLILSKDLYLKYVGVEV